MNQESEDYEIFVSCLLWINKAEKQQKTPQKFFFLNKEENKWATHNCELMLFPLACFMAACSPTPTCSCALVCSNDHVWVGDTTWTKGSCCVLMGLTTVSLATIFVCVLVVSNRYPGSMGLGANTPTPVKRFSGGFSGAVFRDTGDFWQTRLVGRSKKIFEHRTHILARQSEESTEESSRK